MRPHGAVDRIHGPTPDGHVCWGYRSREELLRRADDYVAAGLAAHRWIEWVGDGPLERLRAEAESLPAWRGHDPAVQLGVRRVDEFYAADPATLVVDPDRAVAARVAGAARAVAHGFDGFCAVIDCTAMAATPRRRAAFARFEARIDQVMAVRPVQALCAYDHAVLGDDGLAEVACLHPWTTSGSTPFQLFADGRDLALTGEVDITSSRQFATALDRLLASSAPGDVLVDGRELSFLGGRDLLGLSDAARRHGRRILLREPQPLVAHLVGVLRPAAVAIA